MAGLGNVAGEFSTYRDLELDPTGISTSWTPDSDILHYWVFQENSVSFLESTLRKKNLVICASNGLRTTTLIKNAYKI
jgi:hypothetical protein